ncbi:hypothetical protein NFI96_007296 [Prochilodus magdalenae]|nr:hypothetical protein NFI96_007296 [Prochilodus magdalenae]
MTKVDYAKLSGDNMNVQLQICLLVFFEAVNILKTVNVELGQNILVNCDLPNTTSNNEVYWYMQRYMQTECRAPVLILRTIGEDPLAKYYSPAFKQKFSLVNHSLLIHNITEEELGNYYCVKTGERVFSNGTRIHTTRHKTEQDDQELPQHGLWPTLTLASALITCVFIAAIVGLFIWCEAVTGLKFVQVEMGESVTVKCDAAGDKSNPDIFWYLLKLCSAPVLILRTAGKDKPSYYDTASKHKFLLQANHSLLIQNITEDELGDYFCAETKKPVVFSNGFRVNATALLTSHCKRTSKGHLQHQDTLISTQLSDISPLPEENQENSKGLQPPKPPSVLPAAEWEEGPNQLRHKLGLLSFENLQPSAPH